VAFNGIIGSRPLRPGRYRAVFIERDLAHRSRKQPATFRVRAKKRKHKR
jgi:hypothetical protein